MGGAVEQRNEWTIAARLRCARQFSPASGCQIQSARFMSCSRRMPCCEHPGVSGSRLCGCLVKAREGDVSQTTVSHEHEGKRWPRAVLAHWLVSPQKAARRSVRSPSEGAGGLVRENVVGFACGPSRPIVAERIGRWQAARTTLVACGGRGKADLRWGSF